MDWDALSALSTMAATVVVIVGSWIALRQWKEALATRQLDATLAFMEKFQGSQLRAARNYFRENSEVIAEITTQPDPLAGIDRFLAENEGAGGVPRSLVELRGRLAELEFVAVLCLNGSVPRELEQAYLSPTIIGYWQAFRPVVMAIRDRRADSIYFQHLEAVVGMIIDGSFYSKQASKTKRGHLTRIVIQGIAGAGNRIS